MSEAAHREASCCKPTLRSPSRGWLERRWELPGLVEAGVASGRAVVLRIRLPYVASLWSGRNETASLALFEAPIRLPACSS